MEGPPGLEVQAQGERRADCNDSITLGHAELVAQVLDTVQPPGHGQSHLITQHYRTAVLSMQKDTRTMVRDVFHLRNPWFCHVTPDSGTDSKGIL